MSRHQFVTTCFRTTIGEHHVQGRWFHLDAVMEYMNTKYQLDEFKITTQILKRTLNKQYSVTTSVGNSVMLDNGVTLMLYCYEFKHCGK